MALETAEDAPSTETLAAACTKAGRSLHLLTPPALPGLPACAQRLLCALLYSSLRINGAESGEPLRSPDTEKYARYVQATPTLYIARVYVGRNWSASRYAPRASSGLLPFESDEPSLFHSR